jgi:hypothetical protein
MSWVITARDTLESRKWFVEFDMLGRPVILHDRPLRSVQRFNSIAAAEHMAAYASSLELAHVVGFEPSPESEGVTS